MNKAMTTLNDTLDAIHRASRLDDYTFEQLCSLSMKDIRAIIQDKRLYLQSASSREHHEMRRRHQDEEAAFNRQMRQAYEDLERDSLRLIEDWKAAQDE